VKGVRGDRVRGRACGGGEDGKVCKWTLYHWKRSHNLGTATHHNPSRLHFHAGRTGEPSFRASGRLLPQTVATSRHSWALLWTREGASRARPLPA